MKTDKVKKYLSEDRCRRRLNHLRGNDLASLIAGIKSVVYTSVSGRKDAELMAELCSDLKLERIDLGRNKSVYNERHRWNDNETVDILIGNDRKKLKAAAAGYRQLMSSEWGGALGYPECCVKAYVDWRLSPVRRRDLIACAMDRTPTDTPASFLVNNVYNFYSRIFEYGDDLRYQSFLKKNPRLCESVLPWHPCSYACPRSLSAGRKNFEVLAHYLPNESAQSRAMLSRPVLFWDKFVFASMEGPCRAADGGIVVSCGKVSSPRSFLSAAVQKTLSRRGELVFSPEGKLSTPGLKLPGGFVLLPFSGASPTPTASAARGRAA